MNTTIPECRKIGKSDEALPGSKKWDWRGDWGSFKLILGCVKGTTSSRWWGGSGLIANQRLGLRQGSSHSTRQGKTMREVLPQSAETWGWRVSYLLSLFLMFSRNSSNVLSQIGQTHLLSWVSWKIIIILPNISLNNKDNETTPHVAETTCVTRPFLTLIYSVAFCSIYLPSQNL